ncbi:MAG: DUF4062 domain-containing protein [Bryobacteraceae bacterium]
MTTPRPRVFVSSVVEGFAEYRQAARGGIEQAGCEAVLVNEDFPAQAGSSRNTCIDAIDSCDVFLLVMGARGGWKTPSGRLVMEEEFEHARARKLPVLVFLEDVPRDADAQRLARRLSDYVDGNFRVTFSGAAELSGQVERALRAITDTRNNRPMDHDPIAARLLKPYRFSDQTSLRFAIAPERVEEVFDPLDLAAPEFAVRMMEIGHHRDVRLLGYRYAKDAPHLEETWLVIEQPLGNNWSDGRQGVRLAIGENGVVLIDTNATGRTKRRNSLDLAEIMTVSIETVEVLLAASFRFAQALYDDKDPYKRHQRFYWNGVLCGVGNRSLVRNPDSQQHSYRMNMGDKDYAIPAFPASRLIARADLAQSGREIERAILYWERETKVDR